MNNQLDEIDDLLNSFDDISLLSSNRKVNEDESNQSPIYIPEDGIDPRLKLLSHSSRETLSRCPRRFQLYRLSSLSKESDEDDVEHAYAQLTLDFGKFVGEGIQELLQGTSLDTILFSMFIRWNIDIELRDDKRSKSLWDAVQAVETFAALLNSGYLNDYEIVEYNGKSAVELSFRIRLPDGFYYRGFIDVVLRNKLTGAIVVLEDKTTYYSEVNNAQYKNSGQALGYSIFLDHIYPGISSYSVLYLVYSTSRREYIELPFEKSANQRARWLTELIEDTKMIQLYESFEVYPMRGHECYSFYKECQYLGLCTMSTEHITKKLTVADYKKLMEAEDKAYDFDIDFYDLIDTQISRNE